MNLFLVLGPTCSGKTTYSIELAKKLGSSCVVNCDSRQIYQKLNIGTAKIPGVWQKSTHSMLPAFVFNEVEHYLIDYVDPTQKYDLSKYLIDWVDLVKNFQQYKAYKNIILCGGTGLWAKAIVDSYDIGKIKPEFEQKFQDYKKSLNQLSLTELQQQAESLGILSNLNQSDRANPRRLISKITNFNSEKEGWFSPIEYPKFERVEVKILSPELSELKEKIALRIEDRLREGLIEEIESLLYLGHERMFELGLEYRLGWLYLHGFLSKREFLSELIEQNIRYAKRQQTWLKKYF